MVFVLDIIGLVSGVLGIVSFFQDNLPKKPEVRPKDKEGYHGDEINKYGTTLRMTSGISGATDPESGKKTEFGEGDITWVSHANVAGEQIGAISWSKPLEDGHFVDIEAWSTNGQQAATTTILGGQRDLCIATLAVTFSDGTKFGWTGDWGKICGLPAYYSGYIMDNGNSPYCTWLGIHGIETENNKMAIEWAKFKIAENNNNEANDDDKRKEKEKSAVPSENDAKKLCGSAFKSWKFGKSMKDEEQILSPEGKKGKNKRSQVSRRSDDRLVISEFAHQNATTLCTMENSYGPDFVSLHEGKYCNMHTREVLPICAAGVLGECFDVETTSHVESNGKRKRTIQKRNPTQVLHWK